MRDVPVAASPSCRPSRSSRRRSSHPCRRRALPVRSRLRCSAAGCRCSGLPRMRPVKPADRVGAEKMRVVDAALPSPASVSRSMSLSSSGLPNMPSVEMVMSRSPIASRQRLPSSRRCPGRRSSARRTARMLSKPRGAICPDTRVGAPPVAPTMVPMRMFLVRVHHGVLGCDIVTRRPFFALSIAASTIARLLMLSVATVSGAVPLVDSLDKAAMTLAWPCVSRRSRRFGKNEWHGHRERGRPLPGHARPRTGRRHPKELCRASR